MSPDLTWLIMGTFLETSKTGFMHTHNPSPGLANSLRKFMKKQANC